MSDDALIRRENLKALNRSATELSALLGSRYTYWRDLLNGSKSFGERAARRIEEGLGLPRGALDKPNKGKNHGNPGLPLSETSTNVDDDGAKGVIPIAMPYSPTNLSATILLLGSLLGALDHRSRKMIGLLLTDLAESPDDAQDVAAKASALATTQRAVTKNKALNKALTTNRDFFEPMPANDQEDK